MAFTTAKMGLRVWNLLTDLYDHAQLADNWAKVDYHDHSPGKGVQIPTEGIADAAITGAKLASTLDPTAAYTTYKSIRNGGVIINSGNAAGTYAISEAITNGALVTAATYPIFYFNPADYSATGRTTYIRIQGSVLIDSATAPASNFSFAMYPATALSGTTVTIGAATITSGTITAPVANSFNQVTSSDVVAPVAGFYTWGVISSAIIGAGSHVQCRGQLQVRQV